MSDKLQFGLFVGLFGLLLVVAGWYARRWVRDADDYLLAGRGIGTWLNTFGVAAIGFAGSSVALVPGMAVLYGFWPALLNQLTFSIFGLFVYGIVFAPIIRCSGAQTLPEWLELRFNQQVRLLITIGTVIGLTGIMANNVVSIAAVLTGYLEIPYPFAVSMIFVLFLTFSYAGGFWAITFTDFIQLLLGLVAVPVILYSLLHYFGSFTWVTVQSAAIWSTGSAGRLPILSPRFPSILTSILLFSSFLVWGNNYYWLRAASCRSEQAARRSFIAAGIVLATLIYLPLLLIGVFTSAGYPDLFAAADFTTAATVYGVFLRTVPAILASLLLLVPLAAGLSTATTAHIGATSVVIRDIYQRHLRPDLSARQLLLPSKITLLLLGLLVWILCFYPGGPLLLFAFANAWLGPPALLLLLGMFWPRFTPAAALWSASLSIAVMAVLTVLDLTGLFSIDNYMHVGIAGAIVSLVTGGIAMPFTRQKEYTGLGSWGSSTPTIGDAPADEVVLALIRHGYTSLAELVDICRIDSPLLHAAVARLEQQGLVRRHSRSGRGFYHFSLTSAGHAQPDSDAAARVLPPAVLRPELLLQGTDTHTGSGLLSLSDGEAVGLTSLQTAAAVRRLVAAGLLRETGFWRSSAVPTGTAYRTLAAPGKPAE
ncbi:sodium:solute symporter family transporter [Spirochaeta africana]|uniref:Na+/proline symporter n=1 Tax=Spirochaeta africana (strain ATCC 700263 / DSM 8902 / Z-7692) TaxID=889378 RepID=H9UHQ0_SPIAZ|nr:MarR family transcriptional regulator [Spirochaeta africana]AFG37043.1 Na+/proline symporter [Spirochaeta africana DSM 8902]